MLVLKMVSKVNKKKNVTKILLNWQKSIYKYFQWLYNRIIERRKQKIEKQKSEKDTLELKET